MHGQRRARHPGGVPAREVRDRGRLRRHVVVALAGCSERAAGVGIGPRPSERMVRADRQPRHAGARRIGRGSLRCDVAEWRAGARSDGYVSPKDVGAGPLPTFQFARRNVRGAAMVTPHLGNRDVGYYRYFVETGWGD